MRNFSSILLLYSAAMALAIPAKKGNFNIQQPDGTELSIALHGDESFAWRETADGYEISQNESGEWVYVEYNELGERIPSARVARNADQRSAIDIRFVNQQKSMKRAAHQMALQQNRVRRLTPKAPLVKDGAITRAALDPNSKRKGLCILVQFSDTKFNASHSNELFTRMMNERNFTYGKQKGSVRDYFYDNSQQTYEPSFTVLGPITLSKNLAYYGENKTKDGDDNFGELLKEVLVASTFTETDLTMFDQDNDGYIDQVYIIYAGYAESNNAPSNTIWPHAWDASGWEMNIGKVQNKNFGSYACSSELNNTSGTTLNGIGVVCHEFSHVLGLADMYDTSGADNPYFGVHSWCLMDYGSYNNDSYTPCNLNAWERYQLGWLNIRNLNTAQQVTLKSLDKSNDGIILTSPNANEYYIFENRQLTGWDAYLDAPGMLIYHVDYNNTIWMENKVNNNPKHPYFQLKPADNNLSTTAASLKSDPFPGTSNNRSFTDSSSPNSKLWNDNNLGKPLTKITMTATGDITFDLMGGIQAPTATTATHVTPTGFSANWTVTQGATSYILNVYTKTETTNVPTSETEEFSSPTSSSSLAGWTNKGGAYTSSGNYGAKSPSIRLDGTGTFVQTQQYPSPITALSFWVKGQGTTNASSTLTIEGFNGSAWSTITTLSAGNGFTNNASSTYSLSSASLAPGYTQIKMTYTKNTGNLAIDDVKVTYGGVSTITTPVVGYENLPVGAVITYPITGLNTQTYYYTVQAVGESTSLISNEIKVLLGSTSIGDNQSTLRLFVNNGTVHISGYHNEKTATLYTLAGQNIGSYTLNGSHTQIQLPQPGVFIIRIDGKSTKIIF